jgi:hypothetical protein
VEGAAKRLRPKFMTVATMFVGLIPIMWATGTGSDVWKRIAAPMAGGIFTSFVLELVVYPAIYEIWKWHFELKRAHAERSLGARAATALTRGRVVTMIEDLSKEDDNGSLRTETRKSRTRGIQEYRNRVGRNRPNNTRQIRGPGRQGESQGGDWQRYAWWSCSSFPSLEQGRTLVQLAGIPALDRDTRERRQDAADSSPRNVASYSDRSGFHIRAARRNAELDGSACASLLHTVSVPPMSAARSRIPGTP